MQIPTKKSPKLIWMDTVEMKETTWLWYPYIPASAATIMFGPGGMGKSHIAVDIAARISTGQAFPGQKTALPAQKVLMMSAEDELDRVLGPRLIQAGADLSKIASPDRLFTLDSEGLRFVDRFIQEASVGIVFIDPIVAYIGGRVDINRSNETREFTGRLNEMAQRHGVPIVVIGHSRKGSEGADYERAMGSVDFINAARSALFVTTSPHGDHIMKHVKANYSALGKTLGFEFGDKGFNWTGEYKDDGSFSASGAKGGKRGDAAAWLRAFLYNGPKTATIVEAEAKKMDFNHRTLVRAKAGVAESYLVSEEGKMKWYWRLMEQADGKEITTDIPIMDRQWGTEGSGLSSGSESNPEKADRVREHAGSVVGRDAEGARDKSQVSSDDLSKWAKELLG